MPPPSSIVIATAPWARRTIGATAGTGATPRFAPTSHSQRSRCTWRAGTARSTIPPRCRITRSGASRCTRPRPTRLTSLRELYALACAEADHCRRGDRAGSAVRPLHLDRPHVDLLERRAPRLRAEVLEEGVDL